MTTDATLDRSTVEVSPGGEALCVLEVHNNGSIVESYVFDVVGEAAGWTTVEPATVSVYPGTSERVTVRFHPPRTARVAAGELPFAVRVVPTEDMSTQVVPEGVLLVLPFTDMVADVVPRTSRGWRGGWHEVSVANRGNAPTSLVVAATDPDDRLRFAVRPVQLTVGAGQATFVKVRAQTRKLLWRGFPVTMPFQVALAPDEAPPTVLDAATVQTPILPRNLGRIIAAIVVLALVGVGLWYALLRPTVRSLAEEASQEQLAPLAQKAEQAENKAQQAVDAVTKPGGAGAPVPTPSGATPGGSGTGVPAGAQSFNRRLAVTAGNGTTRTDQYVVPNNRTLVLTDIFLQNPQGDEGRLDLVIDGRPVLTVALANFRDLDYHMVSPIEVAAGQVVTLRVSCRTAGPALDGAGGAGQCRDFSLLGGYLRTRTTP